MIGEIGSNFSNAFTLQQVQKTAPVQNNNFKTPETNEPAAVEAKETRSRSERREPVQFQDSLEVLRKMGQNEVKTTAVELKQNTPVPVATKAYGSQATEAMPFMMNG
jgi:hypothetical protein